MCQDRGARRAAATGGVDLFINARTDVYLRELATGDAAVEEGLGGPGAPALAAAGILAPPPPNPPPLTPPAPPPPPPPPTSPSPPFPPLFFLPTGGGGRP